jgi:hypothetical protein
MEAILTYLINHFVTEIFINGSYQRYRCHSHIYYIKYSYVRTYDIIFASVNIFILWCLSLDLI